MPRKSADTTDPQKSVRVNLTLEPVLAAELDRMRGRVPAATYVTGLLIADLRAKKAADPQVSG